MSVQDQRPQGRRWPLRDVGRPRAPGRRHSSLGIPSPPQASAGRIGRGLDVVGTSIAGMVDRRPVRRGVAAVRSRCCPWVRECGRCPVGCGDFFCRLAVLYLRGSLAPREAVDAGPKAPGGARRRFFVFQPRRIDWWATAVQLAGTLYLIAAPAMLYGLTLPRRPRISTCGDPISLARSASWWPARWPG